MRVLAFLLALAILFLFSLAIKAEVDFRYRRVEEKDHLEIDFRALHGIWHAQYQIPTLQLEWEKGPEIEVNQVSEEKGGTRKAKSDVRLRYIRLGWLYRLWPNVPNYLHQLAWVKKEFYHGIHCKAIKWRIEVGYKDAAQTAMAAGAFWSMFGFALARLYKQVIVEVQNPELVVVPQYKKEGFLCDIQCIFHLRIGHIIFVGFNAVRRFKRARRG
ncbi:Protein of unknown function (DUF2953) [Desulfosporosinus acidiphilus SJ4]|uniref:DUF2953 domain-containing protein n=1 Tax=Desulfosporosinus acidiphilus (strain DSM 22704 / JCM 16185 / SJ4) TaxID=646529 RepID=I4D4P8_DESAJ|nr:DUF2953 domain-containing protein [Desulfosporosinus acidiphilus]AFM40772.1 Protein of unknown function (DUF2953) [Desulfosporosinus acidiphilus SJ4]